MKSHHSVLGIDIGSVSISLVEMSSAGEIRKTAYSFHQGLIRKNLLAMLGDFELERIRAAACTATTPRILKGVRQYDTQVACITAAKRDTPELGAILIVGGERFGLLRFDSQGNYRNLKSNSSCAAGTGSFLDQQARRLSLSGSAELSSIALGNSGALPKIASRCSVFAKTDLIHAQQEGYTLEEICDGLCLGLARNVADTLFSGETPSLPLVFAGGVSRNRAVVRHLEAIIGQALTVNDYSHLYGAIGACLAFLAEKRAEDGAAIKLERAEDLVHIIPEQKRYYYPSLSLRLSDYPDFTSEARYLFQPVQAGTRNPVEVDIYSTPQDGKVCEAYMGIDIGSTSTKAVLIDPQQRVLAGFYTLTAGRPLGAVKAILEAVDQAGRERSLNLEFRGVGTTGSGRKFVGQVIGADAIINEITAHARAAYALDPEIDTIIEIGGQDAKFTTLRNGLVTFSQMNTVCAAGTGSFLEEQAAKLGVSLSEYSSRAEGARAPLASDRCTVFMERDINHYLNRGYSVEEILAASLFSVRENYLLKVASEGLIGRRVCFQGATAKNKALVAAFEQRLGKGIFVSRYCHLTGALGVALSLAEEKGRRSTFRGLELYRQEIPVRTETCELCTNHCRLRVARVQGETVAYGFLCGRDYDTRRYVDRNRSGFDLLKERRRIFRPPERIRERGTPEQAGKETPAPQRAGTSASPIVGLPSSVHLSAPPTVGLPAAVHLYEELPLWRYFFSLLSIPTITSESYQEGVKSGKRVTGAEFCAPITALHGESLWLARQADYVFLPVYLERDAPGGDGNGSGYCYYTRFGPALVSGLDKQGLAERCLTPLIDRRAGQRRVKQELARALKPLLGSTGGYGVVSRAYDRALAFYRSRCRKLQEVSEGWLHGKGDITVVLAGRPYVVLDPVMNKGIPGIFASLGVRTLFQDMLPPHPESTAEIDPLLKAFYWHYAAKILEAAAYCAHTQGVYPVLVTCFKCAPDSFVIEYFKRILDARGKPYLILQIDEHDSSVGYETRIEAGVYSFRNHFRALVRPAAPRSAAPRSAAPRSAAGKGEKDSAAPPDKKPLPLVPRLESRIDGKTLLFPNFDPLSGALVVANLRRAGIDARLLEEDALVIQKSMRHNTGQCTPLNTITQEVVDYVERHRLDPGNTLLWMAKANMSCNIRIFPQYIKSLLETHGLGKVGVYVGEISHMEISPRLTLNVYFAYLFGGLLRRMGCRVRPYELTPGATNRAIQEGLELLVEAFLGHRSKKAALAEVIALFDAIPRREEKRPQVAIFGDLYVRDNEIMNQGLIEFIEQAGGEVVTTPYSDYTKIIANAYFRKWIKEGSYLLWLKNRTLLSMLELLERRYHPCFARYSGRPVSTHNPELAKSLDHFNLRLEHDGESFDNILKIFHLLREHPDISLFVQTNPAFCCPSLVTEAMADRIEGVTGVPVVTLTYDGTGGYKNELVTPYLKYPRKR